MFEAFCGSEGPWLGSDGDLDRRRVEGGSFELSEERDVDLRQSEESRGSKRYSIPLSFLRRII